MKFYNLSEADVLELRTENSSVMMRFRAYGDDGPERESCLFIRNVEKIVVDAEIEGAMEVVKELSMDTKDGELLSFDVREDHLFFLVEWKRYESAEKDTVKTYRIFGAGIEYYDEPLKDSD